MRVLVTGANGFVGRHTLPALTELGCEVVAVARRPGPVSSGVEWVTVDLLAPGEAERIGRQVRADALLHLAWNVEPGKFWTDPLNLDWVGATLRLVRASVEYGARRVCAVGTCFEYDWPTEGNCIECVTPLRTHTLYDAAKDACRRVLKAYTSNTGVSFAWARLFYLYGPHEHPSRLVSGVARALVAGEPALSSGGIAIRDYMDVRDAGSALAHLVRSQVSGAVNIATGEAVSIADIVRTLGSLACRPHLVQLGALPDRTNEPPRIVGDVQRLRNEVGVKVSRPLVQGLAEALDYWRRATKQ